MPNEIGTLNKIAKSLADKGFNILAVSAWVEGGDAVVRLLMDEPARAVDTLRSQHYSVREHDVIVAEVAHKPGMLRSITDRLAGDEIDIHHLYASAPASDQQCLVVFATANNDRAIVRLNAAR
ncbi:MAG TPA: hypothetical protein VK886_11150 [Vicinamibacterales bacterium]|nr:hypothetical protein [Vicinamibacterales bacterium]